MTKPIIGVMGPGEGASLEDINNTCELGKLIAEQNWILLTGGRNVGVMDAASKGAQEAGGLTVGILPSKDKSDASKHLDIAIATGMGSARNNINVLSSDAIVACGTGAGTTSEIMLALKAKKPVILLNPSGNVTKLLDEFSYPKPKVASSPQNATDQIRQHI